MLPFKVFNSRPKIESVLKCHTVVCAGAQTDVIDTSCGTNSERKGNRSQQNYEQYEQ